MKKQILIVDNNLKIGGIQKALVSLLDQIHDIYDVTLLLLYNDGPLIHEVPPNVRVIETNSAFRYMGMAQADCHSLHSKIFRGFFAIICKGLGRKVAIRLAVFPLLKRAKKKYDVAVSFSHIGNVHTFYSGAPEYVLNAVNANKKVCYIHCDYIASGNRSRYGDSTYKKFDAIACVSESTKKRFVEALPDLKGRTYVAINPINTKHIVACAKENPVVYDPKLINLLSVARLSPEKGIKRFVNILMQINNANVHYTIIGDGQERQEIEHIISVNHLEKQITLCGEEGNPYRYMLNSDLLIVPSYHEAAPVVYQEAKVLSLPIFTTRTTSADEMVGNDFGIVVENTDDAIAKGIRAILDNPESLRYKKANMKRAHSVEQNVPTFIDLIEKLMER